MRDKESRRVRRGWKRAGSRTGSEDVCQNGAWWIEALERSSMLSFNLLWLKSIQAKSKHKTCILGTSLVFREFLARRGAWTGSRMLSSAESQTNSTYTFCSLIFPFLIPSDEWPSFLFQISSSPSEQSLQLPAECSLGFHFQYSKVENKSVQVEELVCQTNMGESRRLNQ